MTGKKKIMIVTLSVISAVIIAFSAILATAAIIGKPLKINPSLTLNGVDEDIQNALWYSSLAANSHNTQMWSVELYPKDSRLQITVDGGRTLKVADPENREAYISLGCYVETLRVAFNAYGYDVQINCSDFTVHVNYSKRAGAAANKSQLEIINKRHTDKSAFSSNKIKQNTADELNHRYNCITLFQNGEENFHYLKRVSMNAVAAQCANQAYRDELAQWMRFSDKEAANKADGITAEMIGLKGIVKTFYYWTTTRESAKGDKFAEQGINTAKKQLNNCGAFAVITGGNTFEELVNTGRTTQAFWFDCAENNIAVQPFSAALETQPFCSLIQSDLEAAAPVQMILRLGYVESYKTNTGLRRNLSDYIRVIF